MRKRFKKNNKGFSLVELIVAFALLVIVAGTVMMVMSAGSNMFVKVDSEINLQSKSQIAMSQLQQYFLGCSKLVYAKGNSVYLMDDEKIYALRYDSTEQEIYYKEWPLYVNGAAVVNSEDDATQLSFLDESNITDPFCSDISDATLDIISKDANTATSVKVSITLADDDGKTYTTSQIFTFRSTPAYYTEIGASDNDAVNLARLGALKILYNQTHDEGGSN